MVLVEIHDHRGTSEPDLLGALRAREPLALAEAYYRSVGAAYGCARRLVGSSSETEALVRAVYADLWASPPADEPLEGWARARCFALGADHLREAGRAAASPSTATLLADPGTSGAPAPDSPDSLEQALADLDEPARRAVLLAHDRGVASARQDDPEAAGALDRGLAAIADDDEEDGEQPEELIPLLADWTLGLLSAPLAAEVAAAVAEHPDRAARARLLRRGRRRLEGLPPPSDMGQRILVAVLAGFPSGSRGAPEAHDGARDAEALDAGGVQNPEAVSGGAAPAGASGDERQEARASQQPAEGEPSGILTGRGLARGSWQGKRRAGGLLLRLRGGGLRSMVPLLALATLWWEPSAR